MKKLFSVFLTMLSAYGCSSDDDSASTSVDLLGSWSYSITISHPVCDGVSAQGVVTILPSSNDASVIDEYLIQGEILDIVFDTCMILNLDTNDTNWQGRPSRQTIEQYLQFALQDEAGVADVVGVTIQTFNDSSIVQATELVGGIVVTSELIR